MIQCWDLNDPETVKEVDAAIEQGETDSVDRADKFYSRRLGY